MSTKRRWTMANARAAAVRYSWGLRGLCCTPQPGWQSAALCRGLDPRMFMGNDTPRARLVCEGCPVRLDCLAVAFRDEAGSARDLVYGVRGGLSAVERHAVFNNERRALT